MQFRWLFSSSATLVCGPVETMVTGCALAQRFAISSTAKAARRMTVRAAPGRRGRCRERYRRDNQFAHEVSPTPATGIPGRLSSAVSAARCAGSSPASAAEEVIAFTSSSGEARANEGDRVIMTRTYHTMGSAIVASCKRQYFIGSFSTPGWIRFEHGGKARDSART